MYIYNVLDHVWLVVAFYNIQHETEWRYFTMKGVKKIPGAVRWRGICYGDVAVCLCVCHVDVLCQNDCVDYHATFTRLYLSHSFSHTKCEFEGSGRGVGKVGKSVQ